MKKNSNEQKLKEQENKSSELELKRKALFKRIEEYREKEKNYNEEKAELETKLEKLKVLLEISKKKDEEAYLNSLEKESTVEPQETAEESKNTEPEIDIKNNELENLNEEISIPEESGESINTPNEEEDIKPVVISNLIENIQKLEESSEAKNPIPEGDESISSVGTTKEEEPEITNNEEIPNVVENDNSIVKTQEKEMNYIVDPSEIATEIADNNATETINEESEPNQQTPTSEENIEPIKIEGGETENTGTIVVGEKVDSSDESLVAKTTKALKEENSIPKITNDENKVKKTISRIGKKIGLGLSTLIDKVFDSKTRDKKETISNVDTIIEEISNEDKKILEEAMREDTPLEFESPTVKTNYKDYIKNNIVKLVSGFKISPKIKTIIERNAKKVLMTTAVITLWTNGGSFAKPNEVKGDISFLKKKEILSVTKNETIKPGDTETYNKLSKNSKSIYLYELSKNNNKPFIIVDKPSATMQIIGVDGKMIANIPVLLGRDKGEDKNLEDPNSDETYGHATTPAGKYILARKGYSVTPEDNELYGGNILKIIGSGSLAIHSIYPNELAERTKALNDNDVSNNRMSWGCINVAGVNYHYIGDNFINGGTIYINPDFPEIASLNPKTGEIESVNQKELSVDNNLLASN